MFQVFAWAWASIEVALWSKKGSRFSSGVSQNFFDAEISRFFVQSLFGKSLLAKQLSNSFIGHFRISPGELVLTECNPTKKGWTVCDRILTEFWQCQNVERACFCNPFLTDISAYYEKYILVTSWLTTECFAFVVSVNQVFFDKIW